MPVQQFDPKHPEKGWHDAKPMRVPWGIRLNRWIRKHFHCPVPTDQPKRG